LLESSGSGEGTALVEAACGGEQQVTQPSGQIGLGSVLDVIFEFSSKFAHSLLGHWVCDVHDIGCPGVNRVAHNHDGS
jgi:hypothetical protein